MTTGPPAAGRVTQPTFREAAKQARAFEGSGAVRIFGEDGFFVARLHSTRDAEEIRRLLAAPNAEPVRTHGGKLTGIRLLSLGDDRGHSPERHGNSRRTLLGDTPASVGNSESLYHHNDRACDSWSRARYCHEQRKQIGTSSNLLRKG